MILGIGVRHGRGAGDHHGLGVHHGDGVHLGHGAGEVPVGDLVQYGEVLEDLGILEGIVR